MSVIALEVVIQYACMTSMSPLSRKYDVRLDLSSSNQSYLMNTHLCLQLHAKKYDVHYYIVYMVMMDGVGALGAKSMFQRPLLLRCPSIMTVPFLIM